jgi:phosphohistidine phosphatase SixA
MSIMQRIATACWLVCLSAVILAAPADAGASPWAELKQDGRVALVRHADAPGSGDPPGWRLDDCRTQRNLNERGRAQAGALGDAFRMQAVPIGKIVSSQWCRCVETARLMTLGDVEEVAAFNNAHVLSGQRPQLAADGRAYVQAWRGPGVLVVVTHGANIALLTGITPAPGEIVVVQAAAELPDRLPVIARIAPGTS